MRRSPGGECPSPSATMPQPVRRSSVQKHSLLWCPCLLPSWFGYRASSSSARSQAHWSGLPRCQHHIAPGNHRLPCAAPRHRQPLHGNRLSIFTRHLPADRLPPLQPVRNRPLHTAVLADKPIVNNPPPGQRRFSPKQATTRCSPGCSFIQITGIAR